LCSLTTVFLLAPAALKRTKTMLYDGWYLNEVPMVEA
jgi:hypothetical protein